MRVTPSGLGWFDTLYLIAAFLHANNGFTGSRGSYTADYGNQPICSTEFGKIIYLSTYFGK